jgi:hypothetical protein
MRLLSSIEEELIYEEDTERPEELCPGNAGWLAQGAS